MKKMLTNALAAYQVYQKGRSNLKAHAEDVRTNAKHAIALLRRDNSRDARVHIGKAEQAIRKAKKLIRRNAGLRHEGFYTAALEEYAEAKILYAYTRGNEYRFPKGIELSTDEIIGGIADVSGELVRKAISAADPDNIDEIMEYRDTVEELARIMTGVGLHGKLRHKYDDLERNLQKLESILYDLRLKKEPHSG